MLKAENKNIFNSDNKIWYRWLREALINGHSRQNQNGEEKPEKIILDKIKSLQIVSFNYDRSLSFFIEKKMNHNFLVDRKKINLATKLKEKIHYPYGCLDGKKDGFEELGYGEFSKKLEEHSLQDFFEKYIKHYAERIYTIHEERKNENNIKLEIDASCARIDPSARKQNFYFLGFGFIQENIAQITNLKEIYLSSGRNIFYTNFGNSEKINNSMRRSFAIKVHQVPCSSSSKGVYDAINEDFSLIIEP